MRKKFFQKYLNIFLILLIISGFLFSSSLVKAVSDVVNVSFFAGDSSSIDSAEGNLVIYNASKGFFLLPLSANGIPEGMTPTDNPTLALSDTIILSDTSDEAKGLVIYRALDGALFVNTFVGKGNESAHSASYFGVGNFIIVTTAIPDQCAGLTLSECRANPDYIGETAFSIKAVDSAPNEIINNIASSTINIIEPEAINNNNSAPVVPTSEPNSASLPQAMSAPIIQDIGSEETGGDITLPTIDIIESGAVENNSSAPVAPPLDYAPFAPDPVIQVDEDGSITLIAI
jgi:hypothetical protein